jgi:hypothetical protein
MRILYLVILSIVLVTFQELNGLQYFGVIIPFLMGWYGSMIWDLLFKVITKDQVEECGYHVERINLHDNHRYAWTKNFKLGDTVYYLGHDGVGGWWHGDTTKADQEMMEKKNNLHFYKKVGKINY